MTTQTEAERLAVVLMRHDVGRQLVIRQQAAAELRRLVSLNNDLMDEVARLQKVEDAVKNLVKVKGRYHTEQAFNKLKELVQ